MLSKEIRQYIFQAISSLGEVSSSSIHNAINYINNAIELLKGEKKIALYNNALRTDSIDNVFINSYSGKEQSQNGYKATDFIEIPSGVTKIYFSFNEPPNHLGAFYDENKKFVQGITKGSTGSYSDTSEYWEVKENMKYIRISSGYKTGLYTIYYKTPIPPTISFIHESDKTYTVDTVQDMKSLDVKTGDVVNTLGYYVANDEGYATYDIVGYEEWLYKLDGDIKSYIDSSDNNIVKPQKVDEYGNHTLNNGLIAMIRKETTSPEQWGAKGDGVTNDVISFIHMCAHIKTGKIIFGQNKTYLFDIVNDNYETDNPYRTFMTGNMAGGQWYNKPILANIHDLTIDGNNSFIKLADDRFGSAGMGVLNLAGDIINVEIKNLKFDCRGCTMTNKNKNSIHTIFYNRGWLKNNDGSKLFHPRLNMDGSFKNPSIKNLNIHNCYFNDNGAMYRTAGDAGGDFILIIDPYELDGLYIENNEFYNWGRWVFAIDLGGNGERLYNIKFRNNTCIGANAKEGDTYITAVPEGCSDEEYWRWRALGFIDFETKKCFSNVEISGNNINGSSGFALNGASRVSDNFYIHDNVWIHAGGGYPYLIEFYSGFAKNWLVENNIIPGGGCKMGLTSENITVRNNKGNVGFRMFGLQGDIIFENNKRLPNDGANYHKLFNLDGTNRPDYLSDNIEQKAKITFKNNDFGLTGGKNYNVPYLEFDICNNKIDWIDIQNFYHLKLGANDFSNYTNGTIIMYGFQDLTPEELNRDNLYPFGFYYEEGDIVCNSLKNSKLTPKGAFFTDYILTPEQKEIAVGEWKSYQSLIGREINGVKYNDYKIVCTRSGIIPQDGRWGFANQMTGFEDLVNNNYKLENDAYVYYKDNLYRAVGSTETIDIENPPTHTQGVATCGEVELEFVDKIAMAKLVGIE